MMHSDVSSFWLPLCTFGRVAPFISVSVDYTAVCILTQFNVVRVSVLEHFML